MTSWPVPDPQRFALDEFAVVPRIPRSSYASISLYAPARTRVDIDLSDNTNQWGAPPSVAATLASIDPVLVSQYPSQPMADLEGGLADFVGTSDPDTIVSGCGSDDLLDCIMRAFAEPGDVIVHAQPSFSMIPYFAKTNGLEPVAVSLLDNWDVDVDAMLGSNPRLVYLCAPNNPTGTMLPEQSVQRILDECTGIVIMDEAYAEFAKTSWAQRAASLKRLVVTRTMSKAFGLAGLRIGYAVGAPALVHEIAKARGPYKVSAVAERIAVGVLRQDGAWVRARADDAVAAREWLSREMRSAGFEPLPSEGNFVLVPYAGANECASRMAAEHGILLRAFDKLPCVGDALRVTVAPIPVLQRVVDALRAVTQDMRGATP